MKPDASAPSKEAVLIVDDDLAFASLVAELLQELGYRTETAANEAEAMQHLQHGYWALAFIDLILSRASGLDLAARIKEASPDTQIVILTGRGSLPSAIEGLRQGVFDYLQKGELNAERLGGTVERAVERWRLLHENRELVERLARNNRRLQVLHDVAVKLEASGHLDRVLEVTVEGARRLCGVERVRVLLFRAGHGGELVVEQAAGDGSDTLRGARVHPDEGAAAAAACKGEVAVLGRAEEHARYSSRTDRLSTTQPGFMCVPMRHGALGGALLLAGRPTAFDEGDLHLANSLALQSGTAADNALQRERSANFFTHTCDLLVSLLDNVDVLLPGHSRAVASLADMASRRMGLGEEERRTIHFAALLHDIGKVRIDPQILRFEEGLTEEFMAEVRRHPALAVEMLKPITAWEGILPLIQTHHERWDGHGYPSGLAGEDIPLGARIIAVADAFDAMTRIGGSRRPRTAEEALAELESKAGTQFDPRIVRLFVAEYHQRPPA